MRLEEEAAGWGLAIYTLTYPAQFSSECLLIFPGTHVLNGRIGERQIKGFIGKGGIPGVALDNRKARWNLLFVDIEQHYIASANAQPDVGRPPEIDNAIDPG